MSPVGVGGHKNQGNLQLLLFLVLNVITVLYGYAFLIMSSIMFWHSVIIKLIKVLIVFTLLAILCFQDTRRNLHLNIG